MARILSPIMDIETIAEGHGIRDLAQLRHRYGPGHWKKKKGIAMVQAGTGPAARAEVHWYEAHGIGKVKMKVKRWL